MAMVGARNEKVPPWTIGSLLPKVLCNNVVIPDTKNIVAISLALSMGSVIPRGPDRISGMATVEPNMVR
jgi:hypothetical protein